MASDITQSSLNLTSEEKRAYGQLFKQADNEKLGVVTGDIAVKFFERTKLDPNVLAEIWQIADTENRGLLTPAGFSVALRLIGHCQSGRDPSAELSKQPGPLPRFDTTGPTSQTQPPPASPQQIAPQTSGSVRVPPLTPEKANEYSGLFEKAGARNGFLGGDAAKNMFERARLPNEALGRIWNLADTEQRGALNSTEFIIAMHLIASMKTGNLRTLPQSLPPGLYEAANRRGSSTQVSTPNVARQTTGQMPQQTQTPLSRGAFGPQTLSPQSTGDAWLVTPQDKAKFDQIFASVDKARLGYVNGEQAVQFFSTSGLSEDALASIWDLADIDSEGQLNRDEFAVAMYLIRQQRGKEDHRDNLPSTLPPSLIPPSMRQRTIPPSQPTAPAFDNAAFAPQQPKSAADDLFGLDAMSANDQTSRQVPSTPTSPQRAQTIQTPPQGQNTSFRPFVPTSSFGQGLTTQSTGDSTQERQVQSRGIQQNQISSGGDDLLGDNDPEVSNKITDETMELGNMSNQIGQLRTQMQEVQSKKTATEGEVTATSNQKRELETRLSQFRAQYEQEVKDVKALDERLNVSRSETRKLQQEMAMLEGAYQDLQSQHQQIDTALEADQGENASLKERIQQMNVEVNQLRPQLDKMRSDARQQKGMVAINKKQLSTNESERDKMQSEIGDLEKESAERSASAAAVEQQQSSSSVVSPTLSPGSQSTNPFFRQPSTDRSASPAVLPQTYGTAESQSAFDSFFGPSESTTQPSAPPPTTTFRSATPLYSSSTPPAASPSSTSFDSPQPSEPPPPPESRQITSSSLPLNGGTTLRTESFSSSVKANPPASRGGESSSTTPVQFAGTPAESLVGESELDQERVAPPETQGRGLSLDTPPAGLSESRDRSPETIKPKMEEDTIPGAFPLDTPTGSSPSVPFPDPDESQSRSLEPEAETLSLASVADPATTGLGAELFPSSSPSATAEVGRPTTEFPPIQDVQQDDESESESETGFEDDFTSSSAPVAASSVVSSNNGPYASPPAVESRNPLSVPQAPVNGLDDTGSRLPTPGEQTSPPTYDQSTALDRSNVGSNQFPPEFGGLLPSREIIQSPPTEVPQSRPDGLTAPMREASAINGTSASVPTTTQRAGLEDEFGSAFDDLSETNEADESGVQDPFAANSSNRGDLEFNPMFDSPITSRATTETGFADNFQTSTSTSGYGSSSTRAVDSFSNFEPSQNSTAQAFNTQSNPAQPNSTESSSHDWDAIFSGLDNNSTTEGQENDPFQFSSAATGTPTVGKSEPIRAASATEQDDPILKTLTGMGYARDDAVKALEKYDYNLDMAADYLTSRT